MSLHFKQHFKIIVLHKGIFKVKRKSNTGNLSFELIYNEIYMKNLSTVERYANQRRNMYTLSMM